jgi:hypothetical protein
MWPKERLNVAEGTYISENELRVWKQYKKLSIPIWLKKITELIINLQRIKRDCCNITVRIIFLTKLPFISLALILLLTGIVEKEGALGGLPLSGVCRP